ncbi:MAG TPA: hypothetical protein VM266_07930 [Solirubrobacteraceae bacterium]|nr:hypothetical protein [Solirubrobacteraceae bacterium]
MVALAPAASAHLERPSYWPDPRPDASIKPAAGGKIPGARSLASAVTGKGPGEVRVVCQGRNGATSLKRALASIRAARSEGFRLRPSQSKKRYSTRRARVMRRINRALAKKCRYRSVQAAINDSRNNDRVVVMPGRYTEPRSRQAPTNDPKCNPSLLQADTSGAPTPSYEYQATCPNDQNLIHVLGRAVKGKPLDPPDPDRHGIPEQENGRCIRCNLQIEGSGAKPEDVILDGGHGYTDPMEPTARPGGTRPTSDCHPPDDQANPCYAKHVVLRVDRADGMVGRNFLVRGAKEHAFYAEETDGLLLDRVKFFWGADYGHLSYTTDHHMVRNCEGMGAGDAAVYPGASPQTGDFRDESVYPEKRFNSIIKRCDLHGNVMGYSGSMGNSTRVTENRFYGNVNGLTSDTVSPQGHPGYPADGMQVDNNWFYSNNLDIYREDPPFEPLIPEPIGTGMIYFGYNDATVTQNWFFDNWRQGTMLQATPDALIKALRGDPEGNLDKEIHCPDAEEAITTTSCDNRYFGNRMGQVPPTFRVHPGLTMFGNQTGLLDNPLPKRLPNGVDFWWDEFPGNTGNCWYDNFGPDGTRDSLTGDPPLAPQPGTSRPLFLPEDCENSIGTGVPEKSTELLRCFLQREAGEMRDNTPVCDWFDTPPRPGSEEARRAQREQRRAEREFARSPEGIALAERLDRIYDASTR